MAIVASNLLIKRKSQCLFAIMSLFYDCYNGFYAILLSVNQSAHYRIKEGNETVINFSFDDCYNKILIIMVLKNNYVRTYCELRVNRWCHIQLEMFLYI